MAIQAATISSGWSRPFQPKPPPTSGATTRISPWSMSRHSDRPARTMCGIWVEVVRTSCSTWRSQWATTPLPSSGTMHWRAVRMVRETFTGAVAAISAMLPPVLVSRNTLSGQWSCTFGAPGFTASSMSEFTGSSA